MKEYKISVNGNSYNVVVEESNNGTGLSVSPAAQPVENKQATAPVQPKAATSESVVAPAPKATTPVTSEKDFVVKSPLPGILLDIPVREGDNVKVGQKLAVIEAMKMENDLVSEKEGVVKMIKATKGDSVVEGDVLLIIG
jgi:glutaconyl-CoA/methylmalonyl-CoA decarboxylase subunit gamma